MPTRLRMYAVGSLAVAAAFLFVSPTPLPRIDAAEPTPPALQAINLNDGTFEKTIQPFLEKHCTTCHSTEKNSGGVSLDAYRSAAHAQKDRKTWEAVERVLADGNMPPKKKPQPAAADKAEVVGWINNTLLKVDCGVPHNPGRVTVRRLNRAEYNNTVRDLCGVKDFRPADDFPSDDVGYGFDNIGDVLSVQPILVEKYLAAADKVLTAALAVPEAVKSSKQVFKGQNLVVVPRGAKERDSSKITFTGEGSALIEKFNFPVDGEYAVRFRGWGNKVGDAAVKAVVRVDGKDVKTVEVAADKDKPATLEVKSKFAAGERRIAVAFTNPFEDKEAKAVRTMGMDQIEIEGPLGKVERPIPESVQMIIVARPDAGSTADKLKCAKAVVVNFARRAYRRPVTDEEADRLMRLFLLADSKGEKFDDAIRLPLKAVLVSPNFLFRVEADPKPGETSRTVNEFELATRLSYFLWSSMPDEELFKLAEKDELRKPGVMKAQIVRMLKDPKSRSLTTDFAGQWLMLRSVWTVSPDTGTYPAWDDKLRSAMVRETESFFDYIVKNDRPVLDFLDADYTFVNERLAKHYGITGVKGDEFRQVKLPDTRRGGVLTQASVLTVTSNPTRTSPVKRGKWVLDNLLASPPPPPPPNVPELAKTVLKGTLRQQMEQHRNNAACASCHAKLDPLGFGLENFDGIGGWRTDEKKAKIDATGVMADGATFDGPAELRKILLGKSDQFRKCMAEKVMTFALGRGLEYYDKCVLDEIAGKLKAGDDKFSALVLAIVESDPFQKRTAKRSD